MLARLDALFTSSQSSPFVPPGFEVHVSLRATAFSTHSDIFVWRSAVLCSSRFLLRFSTVQTLCKLAGVVLELLRLDEICVPLEVFLCTQFTTLHFLVMCVNIDLSLWRLCL